MLDYHTRCHYIHDIVMNWYFTNDWHDNNMSNSLYHCIQVLEMYQRQYT